MRQRASCLLPLTYCLLALLPDFPIQKHRVDLAGPVNASNQDLLDISRPARTRYEYHRTPAGIARRQSPICQPPKYFFERSYHLASEIERNVDWRGK